MRHQSEEEGQDHLTDRLDPLRSRGTAATTGTFAATREAKLVTFAPRSGRYVRFVATREINDRDWTSIAELDLQGQKL